MKKNIILILGVLFFQSNVIAQVVQLEFYSNTVQPGVCSGWCHHNFSVCNMSHTQFRIYFYHPGSLPGTCNTSNPNNYKFSISLYRDGIQLTSTSVANGTSGYYPSPGLNSIPTIPGNYYAEVVFEKKKCIPHQWTNVGTYRSNTITVSASPAIPNFTISGSNATVTNIPFKSFSNGELITVDASNTLCESNYFIGVWETGTNWWERTYNYEWGQWFSGQAPANINLQHLATNTNNYTHFNGDINRKGQILFGGIISAVSPPPNSSVLLPYQSVLIGQHRRYTVEVCTAEPSWTCKKFQIAIN